MNTQIFTVEMFDNDANDWTVLGRVILAHDAPEHHVAHALAPLGIYVPRGEDALVWGDIGVVYDGDSHAIVRLMPQEG
jgi:hypothetical protein